MKDEHRQIIFGLLALAIVAAGAIHFGDKNAPGIGTNLNSVPSQTSLSFSSGSTPNNYPTGWTDPNHRSIETKMSLQGKVTDFNGSLVDDANLGVKISDANSCTTNVFYDHTFPNLIQDGFFNVLLGQNELLRLNYNQDYFMCLYVNSEQLSGPQVFRGGQGEVHAEQLFDGNSTTPFDFNFVRAQEYRCTATAGGSCLTIPVNTYPFTASPGSGLLFNNNTKNFSLDLSYEAIFNFYIGATNMGMFTMKPRTSDPTVTTGIRSGSYFTKTFSDRNTLMIYDANAWREVGSKLSELTVAGDIGVQGDVSVGGVLYGQLLSGFSPAGRSCDDTCDDFDGVQGGLDFVCIAAFELNGTSASCGDATNERNCVCRGD